MKKAIAGFIYFILLVVFIIIMFSFGGCTENQSVKNFGGEGTITLEQGQKLINLTWKENNLWVLTRPMKADETADTYKFSEESSFGIMEGTYTIIEVK